jgi:hypothetical protein
MASRFSKPVAAAIEKSKILGIRAGKSAHRFIGVWVVTVNGRVFVRSWGVKENGWFRVLAKERSGVMQIGERQMRIRAVRTRSEELKDAVDAAYAAKYNTPASLKWVKDLCRQDCRDTTTELVPA